LGELDHPNPQQDIAIEVLRTVSMVMSELAPNHYNRLGSGKMVAAAHASGLFQALMGSLLINRRHTGHLPDVSTQKDLMGNPEALKLLMVDLSGLMRETLAYADPEADYAVTIVRKDKKGEDQGS